ncbi:fatty acid synthase-like [Vespula maculifrons]|uniref:Fatty acid synthase-like n=1 Tax=Vespula maculifrons TaxID=7453 RepID=A0ABD2CT64_VESMC
MLNERTYKATIEHSYISIRSGLCDYTIVGGSNMCFHPVVFLPFTRYVLLPSCSSEDFFFSFDYRGNVNLKNRISLTEMLN